MMMGFMSHMMTMFSGSRAPPAFPNPNQPCAIVCSLYHPMPHFDNACQGYSPDDMWLHVTLISKPYHQQSNPS